MRSRDEHSDELRYRTFRDKSRKKITNNFNTIYCDIKNRTFNAKLVYITRIVFLQLNLQKSFSHFNVRVCKDMKLKMTFRNSEVL